MGAYSRAAWRAGRSESRPGHAPDTERIAYAGSGSVAAHLPVVGSPKPAVLSGLAGL